MRRLRTIGAALLAALIAIPFVALVALLAAHAFAIRVFFDLMEGGGRR